MAVTRGFKGRRGSGSGENRVPPGQYVTEEFPVLTAGPTLRTSLESWSLALQSDGQSLAQWSWALWADGSAPVSLADHGMSCACTTELRT